VTTQNEETTQKEDVPTKAPCLKLEIAGNDENKECSNEVSLEIDDESFMPSPAEKEKIKEIVTPKKMNNI